MIDIDRRMWAAMSGIRRSPYIRQYVPMSEVAFLAQDVQMSRGEMLELVRSTLRSGRKRCNTTVW